MGGTTNKSSQAPACRRAVWPVLGYGHGYPFSGSDGQLGQDWDRSHRQADWFQRIVGPSAVGYSNQIDGRHRRQESRRIKSDGR